MHNNILHSSTNDGRHLPYGPRLQSLHLNGSLPRSSPISSSLKQKNSKSPIRQWIGDVVRVHTDDGKDDYSEHPRRRSATFHAALRDRRHDLARQERLRAELQSCAGQRRVELRREYDCLVKLMATSSPVLHLELCATSTPSSQKSDVPHGNLRLMETSNEHWKSRSGKGLDNHSGIGRHLARISSGRDVHEVLRTGPNDQSWSDGNSASLKKGRIDIRRKPVGHKRQSSSITVSMADYENGYQESDVQTPSMVHMYRPAISHQTMASKSSNSVRQLGSNTGVPELEALNVPKRRSFSRAYTHESCETDEQVTMAAYAGGIMQTRTKQIARRLDTRSMSYTTEPKTRRSSRSVHTPGSFLRCPESRTEDTLVDVHNIPQSELANSSVPAVLTPGSSRSREDAPGKTTFVTLAVPGGLGLEDLTPHSPRPTYGAHNTASISEPSWSRDLHHEYGPWNRPGPPAHRHTTHGSASIPSLPVPALPPATPYPMNKEDCLTDWRAPVISMHRYSGSAWPKDTYPTTRDGTISSRLPPSLPLRADLHSGMKPNTKSGWLRPRIDAGQSTPMANPSSQPTIGVFDSPEFRTGQRLLWNGFCAMASHTLAVFDPSSAVNIALKQRDASIADYMAAMRAWILLLLYMVALCYIVVLGTRLTFLIADIVRCIAAPFQLALRLGSSVMRL